LKQDFFFGVPMSFRRVGWVAAIALATLLELSCGQVYRPVVIPTNTTPPNPENFHAVFGISANAAFNPGTALQIDVSGDTNIGVANMGVNPTHAAISPNHTRVYVASAGSVFLGGSDVITAFSPAAGGSNGIGITTTFPLPTIGTNQSAGIVSISEVGQVVTMTLVAPLINAKVGTTIAISGVVIPGVPLLTSTGYDGSFSISSVNGTIIQYVNTQFSDLPATSGGTATIPVPLFCSYLPDFLATSQTNAMYVANYGVENGSNCNLSSTDSVASLNLSQNTIGTIAYLPAGSHPVAMAETPNGQGLYVANQGNNTVVDLSPIDLSTMATIPVDSAPVWTVARADNQRVYALTQGDGALVPGQLVPIDTATNTVLTSQTNLSVGMGANFILYDSNLNRLYVTNPTSGNVFVFSATGGVDLSGTPNDTPRLLATISMSAGTNPPCPTGCSPVSVAALPDGSRFYVASYAAQAACSDPSVGSASACMVPLLTVFDALSITVKPVPSSPLAPTPSLSLLTSPQFSAKQYAVTEVASCVAASTYTPGSTRFRMFTTAAADSSHVYVSICDAASIADVNTTTNTITTGGNSPDTLVTNIPPPFGACGVSSCSAVATITSFSIASNVVTFQAANGFIAGQKVSISGLTSSAGTPLNGLTLSVLGNGLSGTQFEANVSCPPDVSCADVSTTSDSGNAVPLPPPQAPIFLLTGQ
jgi:streptogramin lyase